MSKWLKLNKENGLLYVSGLIMDCNKPSRSNVIYKPSVFENAWEEYNDKLVTNGVAFGELNPKPNHYVDLTNISHKMLALWVDGNKFYGSAEVLDTPLGKVLREIIDKDIDLDFSVRSISPILDNMIVDGFKLVSIDITHFPEV